MFIAAAAGHSYPLQVLVQTRVRSSPRPPRMTLSSSFTRLQENTQPGPGCSSVRISVLVQSESSRPQTTKPLLTHKAQDKSVSEGGRATSVEDEAMIFTDRLTESGAGNQAAVCSLKPLESFHQ
ncbi:hypothetical protein INR49_002910 [Caranx melampygus]|nr:hypothetical protein INR49_002910 [Caranx melampygus]